MARETESDIKGDIREYWQRGSDWYDKRTLAKPEAERNAYRDALSAVLKPGRLKILDVGTGTGFIASLLAGMGHDVTGLDMTKGMMEKAKRYARENKLPIKFRIGDAEALPFDNESFDAVICRWVLWTLPHQEKALGEWYRVTRQGGQILVIDGQWRDNTPVGYLKLLIKLAGVLLYERRNPWNYYYRKDIEGVLPSPHGVTPQRAVQLFESTGLGNISMQTLEEIKNIQRKSSPLLYKLVSPFNIFLIHGERLKV